MPIQYPIPHLPMLGKGSLLADVYYAGGAPSGAFIHLGNCTKVEQEIKDTQAKLYQSINATPSLIAEAVNKRDVMLSITGTDFSSDHLAIALMSSGKTELVITASAVTGETIIAAAAAVIANRFASLANKNLNASTLVVKQGITTLALGTDYIIADAEQGLIYFPTGTTATPGTAVTASYTPLAATYDQVAGAVEPFVKAHLRFAPDPTDGQAWTVDWWVVNLSPNGKLGLVADEYGNWELEGFVLNDAADHASSPYFLATALPSPA